MKFEVKKLDFENKNHIKASIKLLNTVFPQEKFDLKWWNWKYNLNPFGEPLGWYVCDKGLFIGIRLIIPWQFTKTDGNSVKLKAYQPVDTATHPGYRGLGIFSLLLNEALKFIIDQNSFFFNFPNENSAPLYKKKGWQLLGKQNWIVKHNLFSIGSVAQMINSGPVNSSIISSIAKKIGATEDSSTIYLRTNWDETSLTWRLLQNPVVKYHYYLDNESVILYRVQKKYGLQIATIMISNIRSERSLKIFQRHLRNKKIYFIKHNSFSGKLRMYLENNIQSIRVKSKINYMIYYGSYSLTPKLEMLDTDFI